MTKAKMQEEINDKQSTIEFLTLEKTKLINDARHHKSQLDMLYFEVSMLNKTVIFQANELAVRVK